MPEMIPVDSSRMTEIGYDPELATVYVRFTDGTPYCYYNVPDNVWQEFLGSDSKGRFIHAVLNGYERGHCDF